MRVLLRVTPRNLTFRLGNLIENVSLAQQQRASSEEEVPQKASSMESTPART